MTPPPCFACVPSGARPRGALRRGTALRFFFSILLTCHATATAAADEAPPPPVSPGFDSIADAAADCTPTAVDTLVAAIPSAPAPRAAADALFSTARNCETRAADPARALALYDRIVRDFPDERVAAGAATRRAALAALIGPDGSGAESVKRFDALKRRAGPIPDAAALAEAEALARGSWPGAGEVALWRADALRRIPRLADAARAYDDVLGRFPATRWASRAAEGAAAVAIARGAWDDAERRIAALPAVDPADRAVRDDLAGQLELRRSRATWYLRSVIALVAAILLLLASLAHAAGSLGRALAALRPPPEVVFAAPVVAVMLAAAATSHVEIGPAVAMISGGGLALAWLSGAGLVAAHRRGLALGPRTLAHAMVTTVAVAALAYVAITRHDLLEQIAETVHFGPEK